MLALSYGERGESGELWKERGPDDREREAGPPRRGRAGCAARSAPSSGRSTSATTRSRSTASGSSCWSTRSASSSPDVIVTHTDTRSVQPRPPGRLPRPSSARGRSPPAPGSSSAFETISPPRAVPVRAAPARALQLHADDLRRHHPGDRREARGDGGDGVAGRTCRPTTPSAPSSAATTRAARRGRQAFVTPRRSSACSRRWSRASCEPRTRSSRGSAPRPSTRRPGARGSSTLPSHQIVPGSRAAGPARTVRCGQGDNLMVHAAMARVEPGDVLVLTMPEPAAGRARRRPARDAGQGARRGGDPHRRRGARRRGARRARACRSGRATSASAARPRTSSARSTCAVTVGGAADRARATSSCSTPTASPSCARERVDEVLAASLERERTRGGQARAAAGRRALVRPRRSARTRRGQRMSFGDLAHIGHVELLTPEPDASLRFFVEALGMEEEARDGQSVFLRGWGDYQRYSLKLTEAPEPGLGHLALARPHRGGARPARRGDRGRRPSGIGWIDGDVGHGPAYRFTDPDGHVLELYYETERYEPPAHLRPVAPQPAAALHRPRRRREAARPRQPARDRRRREPRVRDRRARLPPLRGDRARRRHRGGRLAQPVDRRARADLRRRRPARAGPAPPPRLLGRHARGGAARRRHLHRAPASRSSSRRRSTRSARASSSTSSSRAATGSRSRAAATSSTTPTEPSLWTHEERARGQAWEVKTVESFHYYGTPPIGGEER